MIDHRNTTRGAQRGIVLISSLLLLMVVTIIALSMFRSFGMQEKIAGNMREKQRAFQGAVSAQEFAENWLINNTNASTGVCTGPLSANNGGAGQICSVPLSQAVAAPGGDVTVLPWKYPDGTLIGVTYLPNGMVVGAQAAITASEPGTYVGTYYGLPTFYIADLGLSTSSLIQGEIYQIDAVSYGAANTTAAIVESTYAVSSSSNCKTCNP
ncbi:MAG: PilX N-terminal domain-containing pilus assembly protein [Steroidobacteraceae bacterium]|jgi:type IV pilus assembly protein PilX